MRTLCIALALVILPATARAQFKEVPVEKGLTLGAETTARIRIGVIVKARGGTIFRVVSTAPVPAEWPEQSVRIVKEDVSPTVKELHYRTLAGGGSVRQMVIEIPQLAAGQEAKALVTFEVTRRAIAGPGDTSLFAIPKKLDRLLQIDVGPSPYIESRHPKIIAAAKEAVGEEEDAWKKVEAIYDWVRDRVAYQTCELKGAARALADKQGDVDELASLFVAMCRAQKIPARTVFVQGRCYAEFYLEDDDGKGHWFPCQTAGARSFGAIDELAPILQKGDSYKNPDKPKERQRFVTNYFNAAGRGGEPEVKFISEIVSE